MSAEHEDWHILPGAVRQLEDKVSIIEEFVANELLVAERKRSASAFSDEQSRQMEERIARALLAFAGSDTFSRGVAKEIIYLAGSQALRFWVWVAGSFAAGAISVSLAYWLKGH